MPVKAFSTNMEMAALRSITSGNDKIVSRMLPRLRKECFSQQHTIQAWMRIQAIMRKTGEIPRWEDVLEDPRISQDCREELAHQRVDPVRNRRELDSVTDKLEEYRRIRGYVDASLLIQRAFQGDSIDIDNLGEEVLDILNSTRVTMDLNDHTTEIGGREPDLGILREALTNTQHEFIPTGIRAFDAENQGVPRGWPAPTTATAMVTDRATMARATTAVAASAAACGTPTTAAMSPAACRFPAEASRT